LTQSRRKSLPEKTTRDAAVAALNELQARQRRAHLSADAAALTALFAEDFVSVQDGVISRPSRDASRERFERYFAQVNFIAWDDLDEPVIEVSGDGTLATVLVHKLVHLTFVGTDGELEEEMTIFAWAETWRRTDSGWELAMVISTRRDGSRF
jgi:ketosteroid isomerase-like protein